MKTFAILAALVASASAFTINFQNSCSYSTFISLLVTTMTDEHIFAAVWAAIGKASNGQVDPSLSYGVALAPGASKSYNIDDNALVRPLPFSPLYSSLMTYRAFALGDALAVTLAARTALPAHAMAVRPKLSYLHFTLTHHRSCLQRRRHHVSRDPL